MLANSVSSQSSSMMKLTSLPAEPLPDTVSFDFAKGSSVLETARLVVPRTKFAVASSQRCRSPLQDVSETSVQGAYLNLTTLSVPLHPLSANQLFLNPVSVAKQQKDVRTRALLGQGAANLPCEDNTMSFAFRQVKQLGHWRRLLRAISCSQQSPCLSRQQAQLKDNNVTLFITANNITAFDEIQK